MSNTSKIFSECENIVFDGNFSIAKNWKAELKDRVLIGIIPNYIPREIIHAAGGLAVGVVGSEYRDPEHHKSSQEDPHSCSMLTGIFELVNSGAHLDFDGFILPTQCNAMKAYPEIIEITKTSKFIKYISFPQYFQTIIGDVINNYFVHDVLEEIHKINGVRVSKESFEDSIQLYKSNLRLTEKIYAIRQRYPDKISQEDLYNTVFSGLLIPIEKHNEILKNINDLLAEEVNEYSDNLFEFFSGAFC
ncbi:MAG: type benzoyl-CoA reductase BcrC subunit [Ignavibacteria bacterium]|nr:type benzoyl-CoA reductase BcrC subunit [Ignavibacteria bacterium]